MTPNTHALYLKDLGYLIRERAVEASAQKRRDQSDHFVQGRAMALYEVVSLMQDQAKAFRLELADLSLDGIHPEEDLL